MQYLIVAQSYCLYTEPPRQRYDFLSEYFLCFCLYIYDYHRKAPLEPEVFGSSGAGEGVRACAVSRLAQRIFSFGRLVTVHIEGGRS